LAGEVEGIVSFPVYGDNTRMLVAVETNLQVMPEPKDGRG